MQISRWETILVTNNSNAPQENFVQENFRDHFLKDHEALKSIISTWDSYGVSNNLEHRFKELKWQFERHFYLEEKAMFTLEKTHNWIKIVSPMIIKAHKEIMETFDREAPKNPDEMHEYLREIEKKLEPHFLFEKQDFYSVISENLEPELVHKVLKEIRKNANQGFYPLEKLREYYKH